MAVQDFGLESGWAGWGWWRDATMVSIGSCEKQQLQSRQECGVVMVSKIRSTAQQHGSW